VVTLARHVLDTHFDQLLVLAGVDAQQLHEITERLYQALMIKMKKEQA
jgi:hypothetical protein